MRTSKELQERLYEIGKETIDSIRELMEEYEEVSFEDLYIGEFDTFLNGYNEADRIVNKDGELYIVMSGESEKDAKGLDEFSTGDLISILADIEEQLAADINMDIINGTL